MDETLYIAYDSKRNRILVSVEGFDESYIKIFDGPTGDHVITIGQSDIAVPKGLCVDPNGNYVVCDTTNYKLLVFDGDNGTLLTSVGKAEGKKYDFGDLYITDVCFTVDGEVAVLDGSFDGWGRVQVLA